MKPDNTKDAEAFHEAWDWIITKRSSTRDIAMDFWEAACEHKQAEIEALKAQSKERDQVMREMVEAMEKTCYESVDGSDAAVSNFLRSHTSVIERLKDSTPDAKL